MAHKDRFYHWLIVFSGLLIVSTSCSPAAVSPTSTPAPTFQPGDSERKVTVNDLERSYLLHIPPGLNSNQPAAVVFVFHGFGDNPTGMQSSTGFDEIGDSAGFVIVYPEGIGTSWNAGACCGDAVAKNLDELAFVQGILSDLGSMVNVDSKRIYATGFSNGALLSYRLACEMSDVFAAIGPVAGLMGDSPCQPRSPVSVFHVHALDDPSAPYEGGSVSGFLTVKEGITSWLDIDGCKDSPQVEKQLNDQLTHTSYSSCKAGTAVELYIFETGGHNWPNKYVWDVAPHMWELFAAHPKP